jgi:hypothetical protein
LAYGISAHDFVAACGDAGIAVRIEPVSTLSDYSRTVFPDGLLPEIERVGYPGDCEIPWIVEDLYLYGFADIESRQAGYRFDARSGETLDDWDADRHVITDWAANPVVIGSDGRIAFAYHGVDRWDFQTIAESFASFLDLLTAWVRYFVIDHGGRLFDANGDLPDETISDVTRIAAGIDGVYQSEAVKFLLGMR